MGKALGELVAKLSPTWQAALTLAGAFGIGSALTLTMLGFVQLPARVSAQELKLDRYGEEIVTLFEEADRSRAVDSTMTAELARIRCLLEADALNISPIARCGLR